MVSSCPSSSSGCAAAPPGAGRGSRHRTRRGVAESLQAFGLELSRLEQQSLQVGLPGAHASRVDSPDVLASIGAAEGEGRGDVGVETGVGESSSRPSSNKADEVRRDLLDADAIWSSGVIQAMLQDWAVLKNDIHDYDVALSAVILEVDRLRAEVARKAECEQALELQEQLLAEARAQDELRAENAKLAERNDELLSWMHESLEKSGDVERDAFVDGLIVENAMLWKMVQEQQLSASGRHLSVASPIPTTPAALRSHRPSRSSRAHSSASSTPPPAYPSTSFSPQGVAGTLSVPQRLPQSLEGALFADPPWDTSWEGKVSPPELEASFGLFGRVDELEGLGPPGTIRDPGGDSEGHLQGPDALD